MEERIAILDGAMGTMIQKRELEEEDYRGEEFKDHGKASSLSLSLLFPCSCYCTIRVAT